MIVNNGKLLLSLAILLVISSCSGGDSTPRNPPPVDTDLDWDSGNWDEQDWQ